MLARRVERQLRPALFRQTQVHARRGQVSHVAGRIVGHVVAQRVFEVLQDALVVAADPARAADAGALEHGVDAILVKQAARHHFELQHADGAQYQFAALHRLEDLYRALFAQLLQALVQLLDFQGITDAHGAEEVWREVRNAGKGQHLAFGKTVADLHVAVVRQADDVARVRFFHLFARGSHEGHHVRHLDLAPQAQMLDLHAALETSRAHAQEGDAVAVRRIHVCLDLENEARKRLLGRRHRAHGGVALARRRRPVDQRRENLAHAKVVDGRTEEHGRLHAGEEFFQVERV